MQAAVMVPQNPFAGGEVPPNFSESRNMKLEHFEPEIEERVVEIPKYEEQIVERTVTIPEVQIVDRIQEVSQVQEVIREVPKYYIEEVIVEVPIVEIKYVEKIVEVPEIHIQDRIVEVQEVQQVVRRVPRITVHEIPVERIIKVPRTVIKEIEEPIFTPVPHVVQIPIKKEVNVPRITIQTVEKVTQVPVKQVVEIPYDFVCHVPQYIDIPMSGTPPPNATMPPDQRNAARRFSNHPPQQLPAVPLGGGEVMQPPWSPSMQPRQRDAQTGQEDPTQVDRTIPPSLLTNPRAPAARRMSY